MWLIEFLLGMFIGYYVSSPKLRQSVNGTVGGGVRKFLIWRGYEFPEKKVPQKVEPVVSPKIASQSTKTSGNAVETSEEDIQRWLSQNPSLRRANGVGK